MRADPRAAPPSSRRDGSLLVRAGAGTGKTSVLVERFVRAVLEDGAAVDSILAITFTEKAAAQLGTRVRRQFLDLGRRDLAREAEGAWISTIHGFCSRLLRTHALAAGIDPEYHVLDDLESERIAIDAFDRALEDFLGVGGRAGAARDGGRVQAGRAWRDMVRTAYALAAQPRRAARAARRRPPPCRRARTSGWPPPPAPRWPRSARPAGACV